MIRVIDAENRQYDFYNRVYVINLPSKIEGAVLGLDFNSENAAALEELKLPTDILSITPTDDGELINFPDIINNRNFVELAGIGGIHVLLALLVPRTQPVNLRNSILTDLETALNDYVTRAK